MLTEEQVAQARQRAGAYLDRAGIVLTPAEAAAIEVADFGLSELETTGLALVVYVNTARVCAKELVPSSLQYVTLRVDLAALEVA